MRKTWAGMGMCVCVSGLALAAAQAVETKSPETKAETAAEVVQTAPEPAAEGAAAPASAVAELTVAEIEVATGIENRQPAGAAENFPAGTEKLYCWTKIIGGQQGSQVIHKWMKGDQVQAEVPLNVNGSPWRTFSSKALGEDAKGEWSVEILQGEKALATKKFIVE